MPRQKLQKPQPPPAKPRKRASAKKKPVQAGVVAMTVTQPKTMPTAFKELASVQSGLQNSRLRVWTFYDQAVRDLLNDIQTGERVFFSPIPIRGAIRRTIYLSPQTMEAVRETGEYLNVQINHLVFTALIQYLGKRGVTFEGFPVSFGG